MNTQGLSKERLGRMTDVMSGYVDQGKVPGIVTLVGRHDDVHVEAVGVQDLETRVPMRRDTIFRVASMTKPVTAVAAMMLVEETKLKLDEPIDKWMPELADRKVLRSLDGPIDDTVPANRPITLRDLLTLRAGFGLIMAPPGKYPIQKVIDEQGFAPGPGQSNRTAGEWMSRLGDLPLLHQPGEQWMYHTGSDILGVLVARAAGKSLGEFMKERIFDPLGMKDTAFSVPEDKLDRLSTSYMADQETDKLKVYDTARGGQWSRPAIFEAGGGGLTSTAGDFLAFGRMMVNYGRLGSERLLARPTAELMMTDQITPEQKASSPFFPGFWDTSGWGFGASVCTRRDVIGPSVGSFAWTGGLGTAWCADPHEGTVTVFLTQRMMAGADDAAINQDFFTLAYQAIED